MNSSNSNLPALSANSGPSPFDQIRRQDETGEWWSARELMPLLGYLRWERFVDSIERARTAIENSGQAADAHASRRREPVTTSGNLPDSDRLNFRLTRYGAYMVAMNGDPRKAEVAAAQTYFAVQTRNAEVLQMPNYASALRGWAAELEAKEAAEARAAELAAENKVLAPKAGKWDKFMNADGLIGMTELADIIGTNVKTLTEWLVTAGIFRKQASQGGGNRNLPRTTYHRSGHFEVKLETKNGWKFPVAYATSEGVDLVVDHWARRSVA